MDPEGGACPWHPLGSANEGYSIKNPSNQEGIGDFFGLGLEIQLENNGTEFRSNYVCRIKTKETRSLQNLFTLVKKKW